MIRRPLLCAAAALVWAAAARAADWTIVSKTRFGDKEGAQTVFLTPLRMKTSAAGSDSIADFLTGQLTFLDEEKKFYSTTSIREMGDYALRREKQSAESGFNTQAFGKLGEASAKKTGKVRQIAGHACDEWTVSMGPELVFEACAARDIPVPPAYFDARGAAYAAMGPMGRHFANMFTAMKKTKGYPLSLAMHVKLESMKQESLTEARETRKGAIPASTFEIPAVYTKKPSPFTAPQ